MQGEKESKEVKVNVVTLVIRGTRCRERGLNERGLREYGDKGQERRQNYQVLFAYFLSDTWRKVSLGGDNHCDSGLQQGWYSFSSSIRGAMPKVCPLIHHCVEQFQDG